MSFAVPCFLMITGWIWLDKEKTFPAKKCLKKVLLPLLSFGYLFTFMERIFEERKISPAIFGKTLLDVITDNVWLHFWYLYMLVGMYLVMPAIKLVVQHLDEKQARNGLIVLFVFTILIPSLQIVTGINVGFYLPVTGPYLLYVLLGYYMAKQRFSLRYAALNVLAALCAILGYTSVVRQQFDTDFFLIFWMSCAVYGLVWALQPYCEKWDGRLLCYLGKKTFGIYIIHMFWVHLLYKVLKFDPFLLPMGLNWLFLSLLVFGLSLISTIVIQKIPVINKLLGT